MPIVVQHGIPEGLTPRIPVTGRVGGAGRGVGAARGAAGGGGGAGVSPAAMAKYEAELKAFYGQQAREQAYGLEVQKMQEQARVQANLFEYKFSAQQRQEIARLNDTDQRVQTDPRFADIRDQWNTVYAQKLAGITPRAMPRDPNKAVYPEDRDINQSWWDEQGNKVTREPDGKEVIQVKFGDTPAGIKQAHEQKMELEQIKQQIKWEEERRKKYMEWSMEDIQEMGPADPGGFLGIGAKEAGPVGFPRKRRPEEVEALLQQFFPREAQQQPEPTQEEMEQELQRRADIAAPWWEIPEKQGIEVTDADKQLPSDVGRAKAYMRYFRDTYGSMDKIPAEIRPQAIRFATILRDYKAQSGM